MVPLKVALLLDSARTDVYVAALCDWLRQQACLELVLVLVAGARPARPAPPWSSPGRRHALFFKGVMALEGGLLRYYKDHRAHLSLVDLGAAAAGTLPMRTLSRQQVPGAAPITHEQLRMLGIGLFIDTGEIAWAEPILALATLGVVAIDYRRGRIAASAPIGFWETYQRRRKTGFAIVARARGVEPGRVLVQGAFRTKYAFLLNQAHLFCKAQAQLRKLLLDVAATGTLPAAHDPVPYSGQCLASPDCAGSTVYALKLAGRLAKRALRRVFGIRDAWNLSVTRAAWRDAALWRGVQVKAPRGHFWADPFLRQHAGRTYCFVEDYVYATNRAHISVLDITTADVRCLGVALREGFHLSFPFLFEYGGKLYMSPEASESAQIRIYQCDEFPLRWSLHSVAIDRVSAADSMFFEHGGRWWLLTSIDRSGLNDHCSELCLFHADSPLAGEWTAHPCNPLCIDTDMGRNAGLIMDGGRIFRAAQRQGFDQYGEGLTLFEITRLDRLAYTERKVTDIQHDYLRRSIGSHHISTAGNITVVDVKTHRFAP